MLEKGLHSLLFLSQATLQGAYMASKIFVAKIRLRMSIIRNRDAGFRVGRLFGLADKFSLWQGQKGDDNYKDAKSVALFEYE